MKVLKNILLTILVIILFISTTSLISLYTIRKTISKESIKNNIVNTDIEKIVEENPKLEDALKDTLEDVYTTLDELNIDEEIVLKILNSSQVKELIGDITGNVTEYFLTGEDKKLISTESIVNVIGSVMDDINETDLYNFSKEQKENILKSIEKGIDENEEFIPDTSIIEDELTNEEIKDMEIVRFIFSDRLMLYIVLGEIVTIGFIILLSLNKFKWVKIISITILASSLLMAFLMSGLLFSLKYLEPEYNYILDLIGYLPKFGLKLSLLLVLIMILILIAYKIIFKNKNIKSNN